MTTTEESRVVDEVTPEQWIEHVTNKTQIIDILNLQFTDFWNDVQPAMYLYYKHKEGDQYATARLAVLLGQEREAVDRAEADPNFDRWFSRDERIQIETMVQCMLYGRYHEGIQI